MSSYTNEQDDGYVLPVGVTQKTQVLPPEPVQATSGSSIEPSQQFTVFVGSTPSTFALRRATGSTRTHYIKNAGSANVTVRAEGSDRIDGNQSVVLPRKACLLVLDYADGRWGVL